MEPPVLPPSTAQAGTADKSEASPSTERAPVVTPVAPKTRAPKEKRRPGPLSFLPADGSAQKASDRFVASCEQYAAAPRQAVGAAVAAPAVPPSRGSSIPSSSSPQHLHPAVSARLAIASEGASTTASSHGEMLEVVGIEDLELLGKLGSGSSGFVEKHRHVRTGRELALKVIQAKDVCEAQRKQILLELKTFAKCRNPHIVDFYGAFFHESSIHIALEYMDAGALSCVLERQRRRSGPCGAFVPERILAIMMWQILDGLEYLHCEMRVIHRDIKPSNLLMSKAGVVKITDFGVSGELEESLKASHKETFVGTTYYMSPERVRGESYRYDSDMWSVGVTLFECASGRYPYAKADEASMRQLSFWDLMRRIVEQEAPRLTEFGPDGHTRYSAELQDITQQMLQKEPRNRPSAAMIKTHAWFCGSWPPSAAQYLELAAWIAGEDAMASPASAAQARSSANDDVAAASSHTSSRAVETLPLPPSGASSASSTANPSTSPIAWGEVDLGTPPPLPPFGAAVGGSATSTPSGSMTMSMRGGQNLFRRPGSGGTPVGMSRGNGSAFPPVLPPET